jgi:DNA-binding transcriptional MerR regulator
MPMQQLDLFGSFEPPKEPQQKNVVAEPVAEITPELKEEIVVAEEETPETVGEVLATQPDVIVSDRLIFVDDKIKVKIKPKVAVIEEPKQALVVKMPGKRGRKSYREIDAEVDLIEVPEDEVLDQKLYYSITEVAKWFKVNASLLRYWENEFDILKPRKNRKGDRLFRPEDVRNLKVIFYLLRNRKFSIEGAKKYLRNNRKQVDNNLHIIESLTKFRSFLLELKANLGS